MKHDSILAKVAAILFGLVVGVSGGCLIIWQLFMADPGISFGLLAFFVSSAALILAMFWASIVAHELGHILIGLAVDMRIVMVLFSPLAFVRRGQRFRLRIQWRWTTPGYVVVLPKHFRDLRRRMFLFVAAGPFTSLVSGSLLILLSYLGNQSPPESVPVGEFHPSRFPWMPQTLTIGWVAMAGILNLFLGLNNLIPGKTGGFMTDGGQLANLLRGGEPDPRLMYLVTLKTLSQNGVRARDWDRSIIEGMLEFRDGSSSDVSAAIYAYYHARDCGLIDLAGCLVDQAVIDLGLYPAEYQSAVLLEAIYYDAFYRGDARTAREAFSLANEGLAEEQTWLRAEAAVFFAEGRYEEAITLAKEGLDLIPRSIDPGGAISEADWLRDIVTECKRRMSRTEPPNLATHAEGTVSTRTGESR